MKAVITTTNAMRASYQSMMDDCTTTIAHRQQFASGIVGSAELGEASSPPGDLMAALTGSISQRYSELMEVRLYEVDHGECPYLPDREWVTQGFYASRIGRALYERLLADGFRRSGDSFYRNNCPGCNACTPIRVDARRIAATKSQRRVIRRNRDLNVTVEQPEFDEESYDLYQRYLRYQHARETGDDPESFRRFLIDSPVESRMMRYRAQGVLVGVGWVDVLDDGVSSVYFAFDPPAAWRSVGTYSVFEEARLAVELGMRWLYLGFYVPGSRKMGYKASFAPHQLATNGQWSAPPMPESQSSRQAPQ